jgi:Uma2 family endonuclease
MVVQTKPLTYEDLLQTPEGDGKRYEIIGGVLVASASPQKRHSWLVNLLTFEMRSFARARGIGEVFAAPIDVKLTPYDDVVPDIFYLSSDRLYLFQDRFVDGPSDLVVEVLSPSTRGRDLREKFQLYARTGVLEYWVVDVDAADLTVYALTASGSFEQLPWEEDRLPTRVLAGFELDLPALLDEIR